MRLPCDLADYHKSVSKQVSVPVGTYRKKEGFSSLSRSHFLTDQTSTEHLWSLLPFDFALRGNLSVYGHYTLMEK